MCRPPNVTVTWSQRGRQRKMLAGEKGYAECVNSLVARFARKFLDKSLLQFSLCCDNNMSADGDCADTQFIRFGTPQSVWLVEDSLVGWSVWSVGRNHPSQHFITLFEEVFFILYENYDLTCIRRCAKPR